MLQEFLCEFPYILQYSKKFRALCHPKTRLPPSCPEKSLCKTTQNAFNGFHSKSPIHAESGNQWKFAIPEHEGIRSADQTLSTEWYSKHITSGRLLSYHLFHPLSMKINVASNFIYPVTSLSTSTNTTTQKQMIFQHLHRNNYPSALINQLAYRITQQPVQTTHPGLSILIQPSTDP